MGSDSLLVVWIAGEPDAPTSLGVKDKEWGAVTLHWTPGFDGGKPQIFSIYVNDIKAATVNETQHVITSKFL